MGVSNFGVESCFLVYNPIFIKFSQSCNTLCIILVIPFIIDSETEGSDVALR